MVSASAVWGRFHGTGYPLRSPNMRQIEAIRSIGSCASCTVRFSDRRPLEQPVEQQPAVAGAAAVEAEGELIEVVVELLAADCALVGYPAASA